MSKIKGIVDPAYADGFDDGYDEALADAHAALVVYLDNTDETLTDDMILGVIERMLKAK